MMPSVQCILVEHFLYLAEIGMEGQHSQGHPKTHNAKKMIESFLNKVLRHGQ